MLGQRTVAQTSTDGDEVALAALASAVAVAGWLDPTSVAEDVAFAALASGCAQATSASIASNAEKEPKRQTSGLMHGYPSSIGAANASFMGARSRV